MNEAVKNLVNFCGVETGEALRMCSLYPAGVIGAAGKLGKLLPGYTAAIVVLDNNLEVVSIFRQ
jgi:N-acetylglucosamine-6-phosphate deacetylase